MSKSSLPGVSQVDIETHAYIVIWQSKSFEFWVVSNPEIGAGCRRDEK